MTAASRDARCRVPAPGDHEGESEVAFLVLAPDGPPTASEIRAALGSVWLRGPQSTCRAACNGLLVGRPTVDRGNLDCGDLDGGWGDGHHPGCGADEHRDDRDDGGHRSIAVAVAVPRQGAKVDPERMDAAPAGLGRTGRDRSPAGPFMTKGAEEVGLGTIRRLVAYAPVGRPGGQVGVNLTQPPEAGPRTHARDVGPQPSPSAAAPITRMNPR